MFITTQETVTISHQQDVDNNNTRNSNNLSLSKDINNNTRNSNNLSLSKDINNNTRNSNNLSLSKDINNNNTRNSNNLSLSKDINNNNTRNSNNHSLSKMSITTTQETTTTSPWCAWSGRCSWWCRTGWRLLWPCGCSPDWQWLETWRLTAGTCKVWEQFTWLIPFNNQSYLKVVSVSLTWAAPSPYHISYSSTEKCARKSNQHVLFDTDFVTPTMEADSQYTRR